MILTIIKSRISPADGTLPEGGKVGESCSGALSLEVAKSFHFLTDKSKFVTTQVPQTWL